MVATEACADLGRGGAIVTMVTGAASGEMGDRAATFEAILASIEVEVASAE
jgi:hypothetical protein